MTILLSILLSVPAFASIPCEFLLTAQRDLGQEIGHTITSDNYYEFSLKSNHGNIVMKRKSDVIAFTGKAQNRVELPPAFKDDEFAEISKNARWILFFNFQDQRFTVFDLEDRKVVKEIEDENDALSLYLAGEHSLIAVDDEQKVMTIYDLNDPDSPVASGAFATKSETHQSEVLDFLGLRERNKWRIHYNEALKTVYMAPLGMVNDPQVTRLSILGNRIRSGFNFGIPVESGKIAHTRTVSTKEATEQSLVTGRRLPPDLIKALLERPEFAVSPHDIGEVKFSDEGFVDISTYSRVPNERLSSTVQRFSLSTGERVFSIAFPAGFRIENFSINSNSKFLFVAGDQFLSNTLTDRNHLAYLARIDLDVPQIVKSMALSSLIGEKEYDFVRDSYWTGDKLTVISGHHSIYTFRLKDRP